MLEFRQNNISLDTDGLSVQLDLNNPAMEQDFIEGSFTRDAVAPISKTNDLFFNHARFIETKTKQRIYSDVDLMFAGNPKMRGIIILKKINQKGYQFSFSVNGFVNEMLNYKLKDIDFGPEIYNPSLANVLAHAKTVSQKNYPEATHAFPSVFNADFYKEAMPEYGGTINSYDATNQRFNFNDTPAATFNKFNLVPFFYLFFILDKLFQHFKTSYKGSFFSDAELKQLLVYNNYALDKVNEKSRYVYAIILNEPAYLQHIITTSLAKIPINKRIEDADHVFDTANSAYHISIQSSFSIECDLNIIADGAVGVALIQLVVQHIPTGVITLIDSVEVDTSVGGFQVNATLSGNYTSDSSTINSHIFLRAKILSGSQLYVNNCEIKVVDTRASTLNIYNRRINPVNHMPDITVGELLSGLRTNFNLKFDFNIKRKQVSIDFCEDAFNVPAENYTDKALVFEEIEILENDGFTFAHDFEGDELAKDDYPKTNIDFTVITSTELPTAAANIGKTALVLNTNTILRSTLMQATKTPTWVKLQDNYSPVIYGNGAKETTGIAPMFMTGKNILAPEILSKGSSTVYDNGLNEFPLRLFFYRGFQLNKTNQLYPMASSHQYTLKGKKIGNRSLAWHGEEGLIAKHYSQWIPFLMKAEKVTRDIDLSELKINEDIFKSLAQINNTRYVIENVKVLIKDDKVKIARMEMWKV
jgi:hypothetical protein